MTRPSSDGHRREVDTVDRVLPVRPGRRRNWPRVGAAVALAIMSGGLFVALYASAGSRHPFLAVARQVPAGATLTAADLATARVAPDAALSPIPAQDEAAVIGRRAAVALVPGTLLAAGDLAAGPALGTASAAVGLDLKPGEVPAGLAPGDAVLVVETSGPSPAAGQAAAGGPAQAMGSAVLVDRADVLSVVAPPASSGTGDAAVTIEVPAALAAAVVTAAASGDVALAGLGPIGGG